MLIIGSHVGYKKDSQLLGCLKEALGYSANTFMFYTGAPQNTIRSKIDDDLTKEAIDLMKEKNIDYTKIIVHAPYIINLANPDKDKFNFSVNFLKEEIKRCEQLNIKYLVLHPGSHVGVGTEIGLNSIIKGLNLIFENKHTDVMILLETMAGKGTELGSTLEEIKTIITKSKCSKNLGVCLDTCHLHDAGYDLTKFDEYLELFDKEIGLDKIKCIHINDSKNIKGSHKDRHENIGFGNIGFDTIINIIYNKKLENIPKILETPYVLKKYPPYKYEIEMLKNKKFNKELLNLITKQG